ncbi:tyrosine--tRNA ligase [Alphaproteobacteria bacterium LSUCC0684]
MTPSADFLRIITERGYMHQATSLEGLDEIARQKSIPAYIGFDCTADSLHVGSLVQIMMLRVLQQTGHKPIVLMGGGTTKVGDPSGKDSQRPLLSDQDIENNKNGIKKIFEKYLTFGDRPGDAVMVDNAEWLDELGYISFLRNYGVHFSVNRMLSMDSVKLRLDREQPMSFLEFNYAILQAYDFMELRRRYGCLLQMGGSDQWGNIVTGVDLTRRVDNQEVFGLTSPLITTASGAKMGKSAQGAIWLNREKLPVWDFWQYWRNTEDADVGRFLRLFTELPLDEIRRLEALKGSEINDAKIILANAVTSLCHSAEEAEAAASTALKAFAEGGKAEGLPEVETDADEISFIAALNLAGLANSNGEARRLIRGGGARLNDVPVQDEDHLITKSDFDKDGKVKLSAGKKRHVLLTRRPG